MLNVIWALALVGAISIGAAPSPPTLTPIRSGDTFAYLLGPFEQEAQFILIDTGACQDAASLQAALATRGYAPDAVAAVYLTSADKAYTGGLAAFPRARVFAGADDAPIVKGDAGQKAIGPRLRNRLHRSSKPPQAIEVLYPSTDFELGPWRLRAVFWQGHTPGSTALLVNATLFVGGTLSIDASGRLGPRGWLEDADGPAAAAAAHLACRLITEGLVSRVAFGAQGLMSTAGLCPAA